MIAAKKTKEKHLFIVNKSFTYRLFSSDAIFVQYKTITYYTNQALRQG